MQILPTFHLSYHKRRYSERKKYHSPDGGTCTEGAVYAFIRQNLHIYKMMSKKVNKRIENKEYDYTVLYKKMLFMEFAIDLWKGSMYNTFINIQAYTRCDIVSTKWF